MQAWTTSFNETISLFFFIDAHCAYILMRMQISLDDIAAFVRVAELKSFNRAADELGVTQSALSRRMKKLEDALETRLLDRTTRTVRLTVVGNEFLPMATRMIRDVEKSISDITDVIQIRSGVVTISSNMTIADTLMPEILERYHHARPGIRVRVIESSSPQAMARVGQGEVEFGVGQIAEKRPELDFEPLIRDRYVLICHPEHPLAGAPERVWADLAGHSVIRMASSSGTWKVMRRVLEETGVEVRMNYEVAHLSAMLALVDRDLGVSAIPGLGTMKRPDLAIAFRPLSDPVINRTIGVVTLRGRTLSPAADALRAVVRDVLHEAAINDPRLEKP